METWKFSALPGESTVTVLTRSPLHDMELRSSGLTGSLQTAPSELTSTARATLKLDMTTLSTGQRLADWKLRKSLDSGRWPTACFELTKIHQAEQGTSARWEVRAAGTIDYRGARVPIELHGHGRIGQSELRAQVKFELDMTRFGVTPPSVLGLSVDSVLQVTVHMVARPLQVG